VPTDVQVVCAPRHHACALHCQRVEHLADLGLIAGDDLSNRCLCGSRCQCGPKTAWGCAGVFAGGVGAGVGGGTNAQWPQGQWDARSCLANMCRDGHAHRQTHTHTRTRARAAKGGPASLMCHTHVTPLRNRG
jgi:hypothetical protein